ncbi:hypothetical protein PCNPT3_00820 [Psychromonas sp. CNPT3]|uniref:VWA domain-containing protein n=1 Tax=Psychromonas sp. CNPT3 TaxID=314282 RepID=UPI00006E7079|nr:VWA domain-containing protein [Psychromonas sp. CNPT3]AGH80106.1 hypothetical protein PCNPT3_00820 [Psychromonas sp. CNPT3]
MNLTIKAQQGSISIVFIFLLPAMLAMLALSILTAMYLLSVTRASQASDVSSIACAYSQRANVSLTQGFAQYYKPNFISHVNAQSTFLSGQKQCKIQIGYAFTPLLKDLLPASSQNKVHASVQIQSTSTLTVHSEIKPMDLSLVLDISGSMSGRIGLLKRIINQAIQNIEQQNTKNNTQIRFSIVPFSSGVSISNAPWLAKSKGKALCVDAMSYPGNVLNTAQTVADIDTHPSKLNIRAKEPLSLINDCNVYSLLLPLTNNLSKVRKHVDSLSILGSTASYQGFIWGVRTLLPNWQKAWNLQPETSSLLSQRLILFTDGEDDSRDQFDKLVRSGMCQRIQDDFNIDISFIGFGLSPRRLDQFKKCIGSNGKGVVYDAKNGSDLEKFFAEALLLDTSAHLSLKNNR